MWIFLFSTILEYMIDIGIVNLSASIQLISDHPAMYVYIHQLEKFNGAHGHCYCGDMRNSGNSRPAGPNRS